MSSVWLASFDIGKRNFCFYVEEVDRDELMRVANVNKHARFNDDGTHTSVFGTLVDQVCTNGKTIILSNSDLTERSDSGKYIDPEVFHNMTDLLDAHRAYWDKCAAFIIETQMNFGKNKRNTLAMKLGQHCWSYFAVNYGRFKEIVEFPAYHKTRILGARKTKVVRKGNTKYKHMDKKQRKVWCVEQALRILSARNDQNTLAKISSKKKRDDMGDVICQLQAFKYLAYVDRSI